MDTKRAAHRLLPALTAALALVSLLVWAAQTYSQLTWLPVASLTKVNAALAMMFLAGAIYLLQFDAAMPRRGARVLVLAALTIALLTLFEYVTRLSLGIDEAIFPDPNTTSFPGRMSPLSAVTIVVVGVAIFGETLPGRVHHLLGPTLFSLSLFLGLTALMGYLYGVPILYGTGPSTRVAFVTALGLTFLSVAGLLFTSDRSYVRLFLGAGPLARGARRMLLVAILMPAIALWLRAPAEKVGFIDPSSGAAFIALSSMPLLVLAIWWTVREINTYQNQILAMQLQLEKRVEERTLELERANKELEAFNYSVSHDLRNPLHIVRGGVNIILRDPGPATIQEFGHDVKGAADRMNDIIEALLKLSRISRTEIERKTVDMSQLAAEVASEMVAADPVRRHEIDIQPGLFVAGDPALLRILLENLFSNAWKFSRDRPLAKISLGMEQTEHGRAFYLRDNGVGFDMKQADRLFQPFHRLHRRDEFEGTGVGLATVARIVHRHGGNVFARGLAGEGATIYFTLPLAMAPATATAAIRLATATSSSSAAATPHPTP